MSDPKKFRCACAPPLRGSILPGLMSTVLATLVTGMCPWILHASPLLFAAERSSKMPSEEMMLLEIERKGMLLGYMHST